MLRYFALLALVFTFCAASPIDNEQLDVMEPYILENEIKEILKNLSIQLRPLDPYVVRNLEYEVDSEYLRLEVQSKDLLLRGFSRFETTNIKNSITVFPPGVKSTFNVKFDELHVVVPYYYVNGMAVFVPMYGSGAVNLVARDINGGAFAQILTSISGKLKLRSLELRLNITETNLFITGVIHNEPFSQIVSTSTTECYSEFINLYNDRLGKLLGGILVDPINNILNPPKETLSEDGDDWYKEIELAEAAEERALEQIPSENVDADGMTNVNIGPYKLRYKLKIE